MGPYTRRALALKPYMGSAVMQRLMSAGTSPYFSPFIIIYYNNLVQCLPAVNFQQATERALVAKQIPQAHSVYGIR